MSVRLVSAQEAGCPIFRDTRYKPSKDHCSRPHFMLSSLPSPTEPYEIPSYPIELSTEELNFDLKHVANLWFKLLAIQTMNGNFVKHKDITRAPRKTFSLPTADPDLLKKELLFIRHKLQERVLNSEKTIDGALVPELSGYIKKLENCEPYFTSPPLQSTAIDGVLKRILSSKDIPLEEEYSIRYRCQSLYDSMEKILSGTNDSNPPPDPESRLEYPELEEELEMPMCCITQLSPEECTKIQEAAKLCDPPVDRAVVDLMCILPYFSDQYGWFRDHLVSAAAQLVSPPEILEKGDDAGTLERRMMCFGPTMPSEMLQLTDFCTHWCGIAIFLDTKTGESVDFKDWGAHDEGVCEKFEGTRKPIEEFLQGWVDEWLTMSMVPYGESPAFEGWRNMAYLNQKRLLQEYNWPHSFPLPEPQYRTLVKRQDQLVNPPKEKFAKEASGKTYLRMRERWHDLTADLPSAGEAENWKKDNIFEFFKKYVAQQKELEYVVATGVLIEERFREKVALTGGGASAYDDSGLLWSAEITPQQILDKFRDLAGPVETWDEVVSDMHTVLLEGYEVGRKMGFSTSELLQLPDDDDTEDYDELLDEYEVVEMDLDGGSEDESMDESRSDGDGEESDEGDTEDLDVEVLKAEAEMELDIVVGDARGFVENLPIR